MSGAKAATEFLSGFRSSASDPLERLGKVLAEAGDGGLNLPDAMTLSGLSREEFYSALSTATKLNLIESLDDQGTNKLRLTPSARSLY